MPARRLMPRFRRHRSRSAFTLIETAMAVIIIGVWPSLLQGLTAPAGQALIKAFGG